MKRYLLQALLAFGLLVAPAVMFGSCVAAPKMMAQLSFGRTTSNTISSVDDSSKPMDFSQANILGLWDIKFVSGGQVVDEGFDAWHADGLETLNDTPAPATGNVCLGVFVQTGRRSFKLKHPSWIFDSSNTNVIGVATIREWVTLDRSGDSFKGTFTIDAVDFFGNSLGHADGTIEASRIKVD